MNDEKLVEFSIDSQSVIQSVEHDWRGIINVRWAANEIHFSVNARSDVEDRTSAGHDMWRRKLLVASVSKRDCLSAFRVNDLTFDLPDSEVESTYTRITTELKPRIMAVMEKEHAIIRQANKSFDHAVRRLQEFANSPPFHGVSSDAEEMFFYLSRCLEAGDLGFMYCWYREKMAGIRRNIQEIRQRKDRNHRGFRIAQDYIREQLFSFSPPVAWVKRPPVLEFDHASSVRMS